MHFKLLAVAGAAFLLLFAPANADASCCQEHQHQAKASCCQMPCCKDVPETVALVFEDDPQLNPAPPVRQLFEVYFKRPTLVGRSILQGRYIVEHDNDRMARGEPCTHIYAYDDQTTPVVTFHCTHLERDRATANLVVLESLSDGWQRLTEFQFRGETASHGYPTVR
jgi:hypothetical protein